MYERCLNEAERMLATSGEIVLPIKQVWKRLAEEGKQRSFEVPSLTDFDALLEGDKRFEIISAQTEPEEIESLLSEDGEEVDADLGSLGFYPEDRVKLRRTKLPNRALGNQDLPAEGSDDEELGPLNVKGLSATRPVHTVETKKAAAKKVSSKATTRGNPSSKSRSGKPRRRRARVPKTQSKANRKSR